MNEQNNQEKREGIRKWHNAPVDLKNPGMKTEMKNYSIHPWFI